MRASEDEPQGILFSYVRKVDERLAGRVISCTPIFPGKSPLLAIGYKSNSRKVLGFIATEGDGSTEPVIRIYFVSLTFILMFLFAPLFVLTC